MSPATITDQDFRTEVLSEEVPVLVAFRASWCMPSQDLAPILDKLAKQYSGRAKVVVYDVEGDVRTNKVCARYGVTRLPVVMLFHEGERKDFIGGMTSQRAMKQMLDRRLAPVLDVSELDFDAEVVRSRVPVLVHFHARWCEASREVEPLVDAVAADQRGRAKAVRVEFGEANARLCARYGITRVPTVALFNGGVIQDQILGAMTGGTKARGAAKSCVNLTSEENLTQLVEELAL